MGASAKAAAAKVTVTKGASAKATNKMSERDSSAGRGSHKASEKASEKATDKGHLVARDSRRSDDRPPAGRSGQKRARSRYTVCASMQGGTGSISLQPGLNGSCRISSPCMPVELQSLPIYAYLSHAHRLHTMQWVCIAHITLSCTYIMSLTHLYGR